jgi:hypothetical protein
MILVGGQRQEAARYPGQPQRRCGRRGHEAQAILAPKRDASGVGERCGQGQRIGGRGQPARAEANLAAAAAYAHLLDGRVEAQRGRERLRIDGGAKHKAQILARRQRLGLAGKSRDDPGLLGGGEAPARGRGERELAQGRRDSGGNADAVGLRWEPALARGEGHHLRRRQGIGGGQQARRELPFDRRRDGQRRAQRGWIERLG